MGTAKAALRFGDESMIERLIGELRREFEDIVVVAAPRAAEPYRLEALLGTQASSITLVRDETAYAGPAGALARGLQGARGDIAFACSCDLPLLRAEVARRLCDLAIGFDAAVPEIAGQLQPLCAAYRRRAAASIATIAAGGERRLTAIAARLDMRRVSEAELRAADSELVSFVNVNTPDDYARALRLAGFGKQ
jgi:molybdenum cofactor guanylyltransferase